MKNRIMKNLWLKLLSLVVAFIVWLVIINITDPTISRQFLGIPVDILNENVITSANQVYEVESGRTVDVTVKGKRSFIEKLEEEDFYASADLSKLSTVNTAGIQVKLNKPTKDNIEIDWNNEVLRVSLEKRDSRQFKIQITTEGELAESYVLGEVTTQPNMIDISGGASKVKRVASVGAMIHLNGQSQDFEADVTPILYDDDKDVIDGSNVTFSKDRIRVKIQVVPTKKIPIFVDVKGTPAEGYRHIQTDFKPESVMVSGTKADLDKLKSITIPIDISDARKDVEQEVDLTKYIQPSGCKLEDEFNAVSIRCVIEKNGKRTFSFVNTDINVKNLPNDLNFSYIDENQRHTIHISGSEEDLQGITLTSLGAAIDVKGLGAGRHRIEILFDLPSGLKLRSRVWVEVLLTQSGEKPQGTIVPPAATSEAE